MHFLCTAVIAMLTVMASRLEKKAGAPQSSIKKRLRNNRLKRFVRTRCLVPAFDGAIFSLEWKEALWDKFYTAAPRRLSLQPSGDDPSFVAFIAASDAPGNDVSESALRRVFNATGYPACQRWLETSRAKRNSSDTLSAIFTLISRKSVRKRVSCIYLLLLIGHQNSPLFNW